MSKYGKLREKQPGFTSWLLTETLKEHDDTMEHPFMKSIYSKTFSMPAYCQYLSNQYAIFSALEEEISAAHTILSEEGGEAQLQILRLFDPLLARAELIKHDHAALSGGAAFDEPSPKTQEYLDILEDDAAGDYLAVLSGGQYLGSQIKARLKADGWSPEDAAAAASMYKFEGLAAKDHPKYVQAYLDKVDNIVSINNRRADFLGTAKEIYRLSLEAMDECDQLARGDPAWQAAAAAVKKAAVGDAGGNAGPKPCKEQLELTLEELSGYNGVKNGKRIVISLRKVLLDVSSAPDMYGYGPEGGYGMFGGKDCSRCLGMMSLSPDHLNDLEWTPPNQNIEEALANWETKLKSKYPVCGTLVVDGGNGNGNGSGSGSGGSNGRIQVSGRTGKDSPVLRRKAQPVGAAAITADAADSGTGTQGGAKCPFSGAVAAVGLEGQTCPFSGAKVPASTTGGGGSSSPENDLPPVQQATATVAEGECPWPFIWTHDLKAAMDPKHALKNLAVVVLVAAWVFGFF